MGKAKNTTVVADAVDAEGVLSDPSGSVRVFADPGGWDGMALWERIGAWISCWMIANPWFPWQHGKDGRVLVQSKTDGTLYYLVDCELITEHGDAPLRVGTVDVCAAATAGLLVLKPGDVPDKDPNDESCLPVVPAPKPTAIDPDAGPAAGGTAVTITGEHFTGATGANLGGKALTDFVVVSDTQITGKTPAGAVGAVVELEVLGDGGSGKLRNAYTYAYPNIVITPPLVPATGPAAGGTAVTINGSGFTGATKATFGSTEGTSFTVVSDTKITVTSPAQGSEDATVDVTVFNPDGSSKAGGAWTWSA
ncbi:IPT/TIG domain-containing protein [Nonomuraea sp. NPDC050556]|uniref:IPT/TIG domain-containing protein n=1 Tax=Nonomuraea sp. NPDC050556 TaxID=3364369 RepID=UPI0037B881A2